MHAQNQLDLDDEPKGLSPGKLSGFRITAARARTSILSMNEILWKDDGCAIQGQEVQDLGLDNIPVTPSPTWVAGEQLTNAGGGTLITLYDAPLFDNFGR
jgi:hypothetical protein